MTNIMLKDEKDRWMYVSAEENCFVFFKISSKSVASELQVSECIWKFEILFLLHRVEFLAKVFNFS